MPSHAPLERENDVQCFKCHRNIRFENTISGSTITPELFQQVLDTYPVSKELKERYLESVKQVIRMFPQENSEDTRDNLEEQARAAEDFLVANADILQLGSPLCQNCNRAYQTHIKPTVKSKNKYLKKKDALHNETLEYRELLPRFRARAETFENPPVDTYSDAAATEFLRETHASQIIPKTDGSNTTANTLLEYPFNSPEIIAAFTSLVEEEKLLEDEISDILEQREKLLEESNRLTAERRAIEEGEIIVQRAVQDLQALVSDLSTTQGSLRVQTRDTYSVLHQLSTASPMTDLFPIDFQGSIPSISGFLLGRTIIDKTPWVEIDSALGQVALLLETVRRRHSIKIPNFVLQPNGTNSTIVYTTPSNENNGKTTTEVYELYNSEANKKFNRALSCLLEFINIIHQSLCPNITTHEVKASEWMEIDIAQGKIGGYSSSYVKNSTKSEITWTNAMRCLLFNCQHILLCSVQKTDKQ